MTAAKRFTPAALFIGCAIVLLGPYVWEGGASQASAVVLGLVVCGCLVQVRALWNRASTRLAAVLAAGAAGLALIADGAGLDMLLRGATKFDAVFALLVGIGFLKAGLRHLSIDRVVRGLLGGLRARNRLPVLYGVTTSSTLLFSIGSIGVLSHLFAREEGGRSVVGKAIMRGACIAMYLAPCTAAAAAVAAVFTDVNPLEVAWLAIPLVVVALLLGWLTDGPLPESAEPADEEPVSPRRALGVLGAYGVVAALAIRWTPLSVVEIIAGLSLVFGVGLIAWFREPADAGVGDAARTTWHGVRPEILLFVASGLLFEALSAGPVVATVIELPFIQAGDTFWILAFIMGALPLVTIAGIHPMVPFVALAPALAPDLIGVDPRVLYIGWITMFFQAMLLSPVSICSVLTSTGLRLPAWQVSVRANLRYCGVMALAGLCHALALTRILA